MPCDYRILQSPTKGHVLLVLLETVERSPIGQTTLRADLNHNNAPKADRYLDIQEHL